MPGMNPQRFMKITLSAGLAFLLCTSARQTVAQRVKPAAAATTAPAASKTRVEVKDGSGDFEKWGDSLVISSAETITLRWRTEEEGVASAMWRVTDSPTFAQNTRINLSTIVNKGNLSTVPAKGHVELFEIHTSMFLTNSPPLSPKRYYVYVITVNAQGNPIGAQSPAVTITYQQSSQDIPQLGSEYCHLSARSTYNGNCALRLFGFQSFDAPNNKVESSQPTKPVEILIKAPAGKKFQIDCHFTSSGKQPYEAYGPPLYQVTPNAGETHVVFTYESKNPYWKSIYLKTEDPYNFYGCLVTNLK